MVTIVSILLFVLMFGVCFRIVYLFNLSKSIDQSLTRRRKEYEYLRFLSGYVVSKEVCLEVSGGQWLDRLKETVGWDYHSMFRLDYASQTLPIRFTGYLPEWYMEELSKKVLVKVGDAAIGRAVYTKQPATINIAHADPRFTNVSTYAQRTGYRSLSCYPVIGSLMTYGGYCTYYRELNGFGRYDVQFLLICAHWYGMMIEEMVVGEVLGFGNLVRGTSRG